ncbi:MAG TPA: ABC transporter ATP-binding protein [Thermomicrobiales bacterium]|nr:ABC transporter ATP-binding protein [Thermomicrobiales bacterium]
MIEVRDLTKYYGSVKAVDGLSFDIKPGIVTGFLGPNGAGKSTTMRMILGLDNPTSGAVTINGVAYRDLPAPTRVIGALLDAKEIFGRRSAERHLQWLAQAGGIPKQRVAEVLDTVGLTSVAGHSINGFSLGMYQRLGIAAALLGDPEILLFDEPVNGLDPEGILWIRNLMRRLASEGRTIFVSSHLMHEMEETADHLIVIGRGRLIADTSMTDFIQRSTHSHVRVVSPQAAELAPRLDAAGATITVADDGALIVTGIEAAQIGDIAASHGFRLHELSPQRARLEAAFMETTRDSVQYQAGQQEAVAAIFADAGETPAEQEVG